MAPDLRNNLYIDGRWERPNGSGHSEVVDPATEQIIGYVPVGDTVDVDRAVAAARRAFDPTISVGERFDRIDRIITALKAALPAIGEKIGREIGAPLKLQQGLHTAIPMAIASGYRDQLAEIEFDERVANSLVLREPYGVVGAITPWNYPLYQVVAKVLPAIAVGCTVVLKPSTAAPLAVYEFIDAVHEAGVPPGVLNLVTGSGGVVGDAIARHPDVDFVSFTGSTEVGRHVAGLAAQTVKKVGLELGGKSANVILDDADLSTAVKVGVGQAFLNCGQTCAAWTRMLVPEKRYDEAISLVQQRVDRFRLGDPFDPATTLGPVATRQQFDTVRGFIERASQDGARLIAGGLDRVTDTGYFVEPTAFADVDPESELGQEEVFGPVLALIPYATDEEALRIANGTPYGLSGAVWSATDDRAIDFARRIETGHLDINGGAYNPIAPFGGYKQSGVGRELGRAGLEEYLQTKSLQLPRHEPASKSPTGQTAS